MTTWIVEYVDGKFDKFHTSVEGIQLSAVGAQAFLVVHKALVNIPVFINASRVQKWYCETGGTPAGIITS